VPHDFAGIADGLLDRAREADYAGWDPFDALNSRLFQGTPLRHWPLARLAWLQAFKRSPVNLRGLTAVPRLRNPKGVALFVLGLLERWRATGVAAHLDEARRLGDWLLGARVDHARWQGAGWGYHFAWEARAFYVPHGTPNVITTAYVATALRGLGAATGEPGFLAAADAAAVFIDAELARGDGDDFHYGYVPGEAALVHNANLWAAAIVAEGAGADHRLRDRAMRAARLSAQAQAADGSWRYGTLPHHGFIDGFHTGYNLEALGRVQRALGTDAFEVQIDAGYRYYKATFIAADGSVPYYAGRRWPEETHSSAQALVTLTEVGGVADTGVAATVADRMIATLYDARGHFIYRRSRFVTNRIDYMRWSQGWAFYALARLLRAQGEAG
jgi:polysaccharide biosynthesis protein VpsJ